MTGLEEALGLAIIVAIGVGALVAISWVQREVQEHDAREYVKHHAYQNALRRYRANSAPCDLSALYREELDKWGWQIGTDGVVERKAGGRS